MELDLASATTKPFTLDDAHRRIAGWAGRWRGEVKTTFEPTEPPVNGDWDGRVAVVLGGRFARLEYRANIGETPHAGELVVAYEQAEKRWTSAWIDSFHTGTAILTSRGEPGASAVDLRGDYFVEDGAPRWGWRTTIDDANAGQLVVRMDNIAPDGAEDLAVELVLTRASDAAP
jgi:hypothetical protein